MRISVQLFGPAAQRIGGRCVAVSFDEEAVSCGALRERLAAIEPRISELLSSHRLAVNHEFAEDERIIADGDEVALIGLVSGG